MQFAFDSEVDKQIKSKCGIGLAAIQHLWDDELRVEIPARVEGAQRNLVIGITDAEIYTAPVACRGEVAHIISAREANREEVEIYEA